MPVIELGHLVLYVENAEKSAAFYRDVLGWPQVIPAPGDPVGALAVFSGGRTHHELLLLEVGPSAARVPRGTRLGLYHFGLKVGEHDDELRAMRDKVLASGAKIVGSCDHTVTHSLYVEDPDGNEIELYVDVPGVDWRSNKDLIMNPIRPLAL